MTDKEIALELVNLSLNSGMVQPIDKPVAKEELNKKNIAVVSSLYTEFYNTVSSLNEKSS